MTSKTILLSIIVFSVAISFAIGGAYATTENIDKEERLVPEPVERFNENKNPTIDIQEFSDSKINEYSIDAKAHSDVRALMEDGDFKYHSIAYRLDPVITVFDITYKSTDGTKVVVSFENDEITHFEKYENNGKWGNTNGIVNKYYDSTTDLKGVGHNFETPSSYSSSSSTWNSLLTNGVKEGSDLVNDDLCVAASAPDTYWAQSGVQFNSAGIRGGWTDTEEDCDPTFFTLAISAGDEVTTRVYLDNTVSNKWWMTVDNLDDGFGAYGTSKTITGSTELLKDNPQTGVWWENQFTPTASWAGDFGSDVVSDWASYKSTSDNLWYLWGSEQQDTSLCSPIANPTSVVSGAFDSGTRDVTWDVSDIEDDCGFGSH